MTISPAVDEWAMAEQLASRVETDRLLRVTMALLELPSPSGHERAVAERYADVLSDSGLAVKLDREFPESPNVIARLRGQDPGSTLQLDGHTDTVGQPHPPP